jgi:uncharacterized protein YcaQ
MSRRVRVNPAEARRIALAAQGFDRDRMVWSQLGPYDRNRFESFLYDSGEHIEPLAHEASIVASSD